MTENWSWQFYMATDKQAKSLPSPPVTAASLWFTIHRIRMAFTMSRTVVKILCCRETHKNHKNSVNYPHLSEEWAHMRRRQTESIRSRRLPRTLLTFILGFDDVAMQVMWALCVCRTQSVVEIWKSNPTDFACHTLPMATESGCAPVAWHGIGAHLKINGMDFSVHTFGKITAAPSTHTRTVIRAHARARRWMAHEDNDRAANGTGYYGHNIYNSIDERKYSAASSASSIINTK